MFVVFSLPGYIVELYGKSENSKYDSAGKSHESACVEFQSTPPYPLPPSIPILPQQLIFTVVHP